MFTQAEIDAAIDNGIHMAGFVTLVIVFVVTLGVAFKTRDARYLRVAAMSLLFNVAISLLNTVVHPVLTWALYLAAMIAVAWVGIRTLPLFGFLDEESSS